MGRTENCIESYWDMLPPKIKEYILKFKESQELIDRRESRLNRALCRDIRSHARLRLKWFIGPIKCQSYVVANCRCQPRCYAMRIFGQYWNRDRQKDQILLGYDFHLVMTQCDSFEEVLTYRMNEDYSMIMRYYLSLRYGN